MRFGLVVALDGSTLDFDLMPKQTICSQIHCHYCFIPIYTQSGTRVCLFINADVPKANAVDPLPHCSRSLASMLILDVVKVEFSFLFL